jgi:hypothetical protein
MYRAIAVVLIAIAACTGERTVGAATTSVVATTASAAFARPAVFPPTRTCDSAVSGDVNMPRAVHIGPLALIGTGQRLAATTFEPHHDRYAAIKVLAVLHGRRDVVVTVPLSQRESVFLLYNPTARGNRHGFRVADADAQVRFQACPGPAPQYVGGLLVTRPGCVSLDVDVEGVGLLTGSFPIGTRARCAHRLAVPAA